MLSMCVMIFALNIMYLLSWMTVVTIYIIWMNWNPKLSARSARSRQDSQWRWSLLPRSKWLPNRHRCHRQHYWTWVWRWRAWWRRWILNKRYWSPNGQFCRYVSGNSCWPFDGPVTFGELCFQKLGVSLSAWTSAERKTYAAQPDTCRWSTQGCLLWSALYGVCHWRRDKGVQL